MNSTLVILKIHTGMIGTTMIILPTGISTTMTGTTGMIITTGTATGTTSHMTSTMMETLITMDGK